MSSLEVDPDTQETPPADERNADESGCEADTATDTESVEISESSAGEPTYSHSKRTRWASLLFVLFTVGAIITLNASLFIIAALLLVFIGAGFLTRPTPPAENVSVSYTLTPGTTRPGSRVTIELTVTNCSDQTLSDVRATGEVPTTLSVISGSPRVGGTIAPGESIQTEYTIIARRGDFAFNHATIQLRGGLNSVSVSQSVPSQPSPTIRCLTQIDEIPIEATAANYIGDLLSSTGGEGVEFYSTREYHRGDQIGQINWRELAKRGELSTITYRERKATTISLVIDLRNTARVRSGIGETSAAMLGVYAGYQLATSLLNQGHTVGICLLGIDRPTDQFEDYVWIDHNSWSQHHQLFDLFDEIEETISQTGPREISFNWRNEQVKSIETIDLDRLFDLLTVGRNQENEIVFISPLHDQFSRDFITKLEAQELPPTIISPDVLSQPESGYEQTQIHQVAVAGDEILSSEDLRKSLRLQRATEIERLRQSNMTVIDWHPAKPLAVCCQEQTHDAW